MRAKRTETPYCNIPHHVPAANHKRQLEHKNQELDRVTAENTALRALLGLGPDHPDENLRVLTELAAALTEGRQAGWQQGPDTTNPNVNTGKPQSRPPYKGDPGARTATYILRSKTTEAVDAFNSRKDNNWNSPLYQLESNEG